MMSESTNRRVLVIDDNPAIHRDFQKVLARRRSSDALDDLEAELFGATSVATSETFDVDQALQGADGIERVRKAREAGDPYAVAFVDVRMPPGLDGIETTRALWEIDPELQVVICTAYSDYTWDQTVAQLGAGDRWLVLRKPFDVVEVRQLAHALVHKWSLARQARRRGQELEAQVAARTKEAYDALGALRTEMERRQRMEAELRLAHKLEAVGQLAAGIAHELNTPLQFTQDNVDFLDSAFRSLVDVIDCYRTVTGRYLVTEASEKLRAAEDDADLEFLVEKVPGAFTACGEGFGRMSRIVRSLLEFAHPDRDGAEPSDLNRAVESTLTISHNEYKYVADLKVELDPTLPPVRCHSGEINQVLLNLVVNAAHAIADRYADSDERGTITVRTRRVDGDTVAIDISDDGSGIPEGVRDQIFDPFFTTKPLGKGTGQGLALARNTVVARHGGTLTFDTVVGEGTTFTIALPIAGPPPQ